MSKRTALMPQFQGSVRNPKAVHGLNSIVLSHEMNEFIQTEALDLFTIASNAGMPFREALAVIYLSGMDTGRQASAGG